MARIDTIYDRYGNPRLQVFDNGRLVLFNGQSAGFLYKEHVYDYNGSHRGWYEQGILRDYAGACVGFGEVVKSIHPLLPLKKLKPLPGLTHLEPLRPLRALPPLKPLRRMAWSRLNPIELLGLRCIRFI
jgi:hypothetical protein